MSIGYIFFKFVCYNWIVKLMNFYWVIEFDRREFGELCILDVVIELELFEFMFWCFKFCIFEFFLIYFFMCFLRVFVIEKGML